VPPDKNAPFRLLVEGKDDAFATAGLMKAIGFDTSGVDPRFPFIDQAGGVDELLDIIVPTAKGSYKRVGVVVDADEDCAARWSAVRTRLLSLGLMPPEVLPVEGYVGPGTGSVARLGVWVMPDNETPGMLEDFLGGLIDPNEPCWLRIRQLVADAAGANCVRDSLPKATLRTWLAWQDPGGLPFGTAIEAGHLDTGRPGAQQFVAWFRRLFIDP
jgi:hypothetical protein